MRVYVSRHDSMETQKLLLVCNTVIDEIQKRVDSGKLKGSVRDIFEKWLINQIYVGSKMVVENGCITYKLFTYDEAIEIRNRIIE